MTLINCEGCTLLTPNNLVLCCWCGIHRKQQTHDQEATWTKRGGK